MTNRRNPILTLFFALTLTALSAAAQEKPRIIELHTKRFEFGPKELVLKKGETVTLRVTSDDVAHGIFQRALKIDTVVQPGETQDITITPQTAGRFITICHHFCGSQHGSMKMIIAVEE